MKIQEQAPAKINLTLDILGRRSDGYHELRMVMQSVSLCDTVTVEETGIGFALLADGFTIPAGKSSLEQQAAEAFFAAVGRPMPPLTVHLEKTTPAYAGLGGGSADVAALLRCLRRQYAPEMPVEQLRAIGLTVGSDMPFCVSGGTALAEGRGGTADGAACPAGLLDRTVQAGIRHPHACAVHVGGCRDTEKPPGYRRHDPRTVCGGSGRRSGTAVQRVRGISARGIP